MWTVLSGQVSRGGEDSGGRNLTASSLTQGSYSLRIKKSRDFHFGLLFFFSFLFSSLLCLAQMILRYLSLCALVRADAKGRRQEKEKEAGRS